MAEQDKQRIGFTDEEMEMQERRNQRKDQAAAFASWLNSMRMTPDANLPAQLQAAQEKRASSIRKNRTVNMLEAAGQTELAKQVASGAITGKTAVQQMFQLAAEERQAQRAAAAQARSFENQMKLARMKDSRTALMKQAEAAGLTVGSDEYKKYILSGGDVYGSGAPVEFGPLEKGTMLVQGRDAQGNITYQVQPIAGSQAEQDAQRAADAITKKTGAEVTSGTTVLGDISEMKKKIEANPTLTTGMIGSALLRMGFTTAVDVNELGETIRANIGFNRLQRMREESPTGGALGQVAVQELNALQASLGSLKTSQSADQLIRNLERLETQYQQSMKRILNTEGGSAYFSQNEIDIIMGTGNSGTQATDQELLDKYG